MDTPFNVSNRFARKAVPIDPIFRYNAWVESFKQKTFKFFRCYECGKFIYADFVLFQKHIMEFHGGWEKKSVKLKPFKFTPEVSP